MKTILNILNAAGQPANAFFHLKIENGSWMPLVIEGIGEGPNGFPAISVCHYGEQNGDLMRDPEMCFEVAADPRNGKPALYPYYWRNDYAGIEQESTFRDDAGRLMIRPRMKREHQNFARTWDKNLRDQGFLDAAQFQAGHRTPEDNL